MASFTVRQGNGESGLSETVADEVEALLAATERAAEALRGEARREIDTALADLGTLVAELRDAANRLEKRVEDIRGETGDPDAPAAQRDGYRRARLVAVNMAANGASRIETARYLSRHLGIRDRDALLDAVYDWLGAG